jgi:glycerol-3-phosphate dehydrogenase
VSLYDFLAGKSNLSRSRTLLTQQISGDFPGLKDHGLQGGAAYFDAQMDDARLCLEVLQTSARQGGCFANYVEAVGFEKRDGNLMGVKAVDRIKGGEFVVHARQFLNAAGPWVDEVSRMAGDVGGPYLQPTKGVHLVVASQGMSSAFLLLHPADGRVFFVLPWQGKTLIGTTDTLMNESPDQMQITDADIKYLLTGFNHYFRPTLAESDVINHFVGARPLLHAKANDPSSLSREFRVWTSPSGLISVAGGKYTTYRAMAEAVTDEVAKRLGKRGPCRTRQAKLDGTPSEPWPLFEHKEPDRLCKQFSINYETTSHLVNRYGSRAADIAAYLEQDRSLAQTIVPGEPDLRAELAYQRDHEMALLPADFLLRRTRLGLFHPELLKLDNQAMFALGDRQGQ